MTEFLDAPLPDLTPAFERSGLMDVAYVVTDSPVGRLLLAGTERGLVLVAYLDIREAPTGVGETREVGEDEVLTNLSERLSPRILRAPSRFDTTRRELDEFFDGRRTDFEIPLDWSLIRPGFTRAVLTATSQIPFGETTTYKGVATTAGSQNAYRAAGSALGSNPLPIVVPCHRVLHADGGLGGYTGGLDRKRALLAVEGHQPR